MGHIGEQTFGAFGYLAPDISFKTASDVGKRKVLSLRDQGRRKRLAVRAVTRFSKRPILVPQATEKKIEKRREIDKNTHNTRHTELSVARMDLLKRFQQDISWLQFYEKIPSSIFCFARKTYSSVFYFVQMFLLTKANLSGVL